mmetsp:Transcript_2469/g.9460  ORF Transcript_2469/g.9460 Transcript_2469/m.9460 type:complete len:112 (+) Transcript_2469:1828-2163(+)
MTKLHTPCALLTLVLVFFLFFEKRPSLTETSILYSAAPSGSTMLLHLPETLFDVRHSTTILPLPVSQQHYLGPLLCVTLLLSHSYSYFPVRLRPTKLAGSCHRRPRSGRRP